MLNTPKSGTGLPAIIIGFVAVIPLISGLLAACSPLPFSNSTNGAVSIPEWKFSWSPVGGAITARTDPHTAFADAGRAEHITLRSTTEQLPAAIIWLAAGRDFGEVVVQLDPAGRYWNLVTLLIDAQSQTWQAYAGDLPTPSPCGSGLSFTGAAATLGSYCTLEPVQSGTPPSRVVTIWTTPDARTFIAARIAATALSPDTSAKPYVFADYSGWLLQTNGWTVIVTLLPSGESAVFAGTGDSTQCQQFGEDFLRLGADPTHLQ